MTLSLDGARECVVGPNRAMVQCGTAMWTFRYHNGYTVVHRGPFTAHVAVTYNAILDVTLDRPAPTTTSVLKIDHIQFDSYIYEKHVAVDVIGGNRLDINKAPPINHTSASIRTFTRNGVVVQPRSLQVDQRDEERHEKPRITYERAFIPADPVNAFGIPQATMGCLEVAALPISMQPYFHSGPPILDTDSILAQGDTLTIQLHDHQPESHDIQGDLESTIGIVESPEPEQLLELRVPFSPFQQVSLYSRPDWHLTR
jgi:LIM-domain binding protein